MTKVTYLLDKKGIDAPIQRSVEKIHAFHNHCYIDYG